MNIRLEGKDLRIRFRIEEFELFLTKSSFCQIVSFGPNQFFSFEFRFELGENFDVKTQVSGGTITFFVRFPKPAAVDLASCARDGRNRKELTRTFKTDFAGENDLYQVHLEVDSLSLKSKTLPSES